MAAATLADYFLAQGAELVGVDFAPAMIELPSALSDANWIVADMTALPDLGVFDAIVSWDGFFHLSPVSNAYQPAQNTGLLKPQGRLLLTVGPGAGEVDGWVEGEQVYHASLSIEEYWIYWNKPVSAYDLCLSISKPTAAVFCWLNARSVKGGYWPRYPRLESPPPNPPSTTAVTNLGREVGVDFSFGAGFG